MAKYPSLCMGDKRQIRFVYTIRRYGWTRCANLPKAEIGKMVVKNQNLCVERGKSRKNIFRG